MTLVSNVIGFTLAVLMLTFGGAVIWTGRILALLIVLSLITWIAMGDITYIYTFIADTIVSLTSSSV